MVCLWPLVVGIGRGMGGAPFSGVTKSEGLVGGFLMLGGVLLVEPVHEIVPVDWCVRSPALQKKRTRSWVVVTRCWTWLAST